MNRDSVETLISEQSGIVWEPRRKGYSCTIAKMWYMNCFWCYSRFCDYVVVSAYLCVVGYDHVIYMLKLWFEYLWYLCHVKTLKTNKERDNITSKIGLWSSDVLLYATQKKVKGLNNSLNTMSNIFTYNSFGSIMSKIFQEP